MSAEMDSTTDSERIFVRLLGEGTTVYRPTSAARVGPDSVRLGMPKDYDPEDEDWEFKPGSIVRTERRVLHGREVQVAVSAVPER